MIRIGAIAMAMLLSCPCAIRAQEGNTMPTGWTIGIPVLLPGEAGAFDSTAVKDPSVVKHGGKWHVFYTSACPDGYGVGYVAAERLDDLQNAPRFHLKQLGGKSDPYAAAPQVFYFVPQETWYLVYQTRDSNYQPVYATTRTIEDPASWTGPVDLVQKEEPEKWIDFWIICDETTAYLFYTRAHIDVYAMTTPLAEFPAGFRNPRKVFGPVHEAVHVYKAAGANEYHMLYEMRAEDGARRFGLATANTLSGPWRNKTDAYATQTQLLYPKTGPVWTDEVSHGEMIRTGHDQRMEYDPEHAQFLIQGLKRSQHKGRYEALPWRLGIITKQLARTSHGGVDEAR
jgi:Glycosyl hydrolase family 62